MATNVSLLECAVCIDLMLGPIYQCARGHSLCENCLKQLQSPKKCPLCRDDMTGVRNIIVESMVEIELQRRLEELNVRNVEGQATPETTKIHCRFKSEGCKFLLPQKDFENHVEECIYRDMLCPFSTFNNSCHWIGKFSKLKNHFSTQHPDAILASECEYTAPNLENCTGMVRLILLDKLHFILCWQWDAIKKIHLIAVQNIGMKSYAHSWNYDLKLYKAEEPRRSITFTDICKSDSEPTSVIFQNKHCIVIPTSIFNEYGTRLRFKIILHKNESTVSKSRKGPLRSSSASSSPLAAP